MSLWSSELATIQNEGLVICDRYTQGTATLVKDIIVIGIVSVTFGVDYPSVSTIKGAVVNGRRTNLQKTNTLAKSCITRQSRKR